MLSRPLARFPRDADSVLRGGGSSLRLADFSASASSIFQENPEVLRRLTGLGPDLEKRERKKKADRRVIETKWSQPPVKDVTPTSPPQSTADCAIGHASVQKPRKGLSAVLEKYSDFKASGVDPEIRSTVEKAMTLLPRGSSLEKRDRLKKLFHIDHSVESLIASGQASTENFNLLIRALAVRGKQNEALQIPEKMENLGFVINADTAVSCIIACGKDAALAREIFLQFRARAITADVKVYGALMHAHVREGDLSAVGALIRKAEDEGLHISVPMWTTLISGLIRKGMTIAAFDEFNRVRTWKAVKPDTVLFTTLIKGCVKKAECERALNIFTDLEISGCIPSDVTYTTLMEVMAKRRDYAKKTFEFYDRMQCEEFPLTKAVATSLLTASASLGDIRLFRKYSDHIMAAGFPFTREFFLLGLKTCAEAMTLPRICTSEKDSYVAIANELVHNMRHRGLVINSRTLNGLMEVYQKASLPEQTLRVLDEFQKLSLLPHKQTFGILFALFAEHKELTDKFFALFDEYPQHHTAGVVRKALDLAISSRSSNKVVMVLDVMNKAAVFPTPEQAEQLAKAGRKIVGIHEAVGALVKTHKHKTNEHIKRRDQMIQLDMREHEIRLAKIAKTTRSPTPAQKARDKFFDNLKRITGGHSRPFLPLAQYHQLTKRGGELYAKKRDRPGINRLLL
ncbi:hypothetical protein C9890_0584 [Perkinsus sp. BL_2016]|nr:hypothetical protein C9890_0584 [Perkinsus sp. BL_2016]